MSGRLVAVKSPSFICGSSCNICYFIVIKRSLVSELNKYKKVSLQVSTSEKILTQQAAIESEEEKNRDESNSLLRESNVKVKRNDKEGNLEVAIITVEAVSGQLLYTGVANKDLFASVPEAMNAIHALCPQTEGQLEVQTVCEFDAFAGACLTEEFIHLLLIEESTQVLGDMRLRTFDSTIADQMLFDGISFSYLSSSVPFVFAVKKAEWYSIPLRIAVPALQQPLTSDAVATWTLGASDTTKETFSCHSFLSSFLTPGGDVLPPYLYFSPVVDVTHCGVFSNAVKCAVGSKKGGVGNCRQNCHSQRTAFISVDDGSFFMPAYINEYFPQLPTRTGREALGRCDCLWNEELIAFCELFGIGDFCCRLALGSCCFVPLLHPASDSQAALLLVRLSRLASAGCFYDYTPNSAQVKFDHYFSLLETEFQLLVLRDCSSDYDAETLSDAVSTLTWRRGADFYNCSEILEQRKRFERSADTFTDSLPPYEDHVAAIFASYLERYGSQTKIFLSHAGSGAVRNKHNCTTKNASDELLSKKSVSSYASSRNLSPKVSNFGIFQRSPVVGRNTRAQLCELEAEGQDGIEVSSMDSSYLLGPDIHASLCSLAEHVKAHALWPLVVIGRVSSVYPPSFFFPDVTCASVGGFLTTLWGKDVPGFSVEKMQENWVPRVCVREKTHVSIIASIIVSVCWVVEWLHKQQCGGGDVVKFVLEQEIWVDDIIRIIFSATVWDRPFRVACLMNEAVASVRHCLLSVYKEPPTAFSRIVWHAAREIESLAHHTAEATGLCVCGDGQHNMLFDNVMLSFLKTFFLTGGKFYPRELVRHRVVLLSHPSQMFSIISLRLMVPFNESDGFLTTFSESDLEAKEPLNFWQERRMFSLSPMQQLTFSVSFGEDLLRASCSLAVPTPTLCMFQGLAHPFSQPLRLSSSFKMVEFTVALPFLSYVTHIALTVVNDFYEVPYAGTHSFSLATSCYFGQDHERAVFEDVLLPHYVGDRADHNTRGSARLVFFELYRPSNERTTFSVLEETAVGIGELGRGYSCFVPVIARFLRFSFCGSGSHPIAVPPLLVFGEPLGSIPRNELHAVVGRNTTLRRAFDMAQPFFCFGTRNDMNNRVRPALLSNSVVAASDTNGSGGMNNYYTVAKGSSTDTKNKMRDAIDERLLQGDTEMAIQRRQAMYMYKVVSALWKENFWFNFSLAVELEFKRLQCGVCRFYRDLCLLRIGIPRCVVNPAFYVFPHSAVYRSRLVDDAKSDVFLKGQQPLPCGSLNKDKKKVGLKYKNRKYCNCCLSYFSWFSSLKECAQCQRYVCKKCLSDNFVPLFGLGIFEASSRVCLDCLKKVVRLEETLRNFFWSEHNYELESDAEKDVAIDFYTPCTTPQLASVLMLYPPNQWRHMYKMSLLTSISSPYLLTIYPLTQVVSAPGMPDAKRALFEDVIGVPGVDKDAFLGWQCVSNEEFTDSVTRVCRHVMLLLPHNADIFYGVLRYALAGALRGVIEIQLFVGESVQTLQPFQSATLSSSEVSYGDDNFSATSFDFFEKGKLKELYLFQSKSTLHCDTKDALHSLPSCASSPLSTISRRSTTAARLIAIYFIGAVSDLSLLQIYKFSLWGRFTTKMPYVNSVYYNCRSDVCCYLVPATNTAHATSAVPGVACTPQTVFMAHIIPLRSVIPHTATDLILTEFDFGVPVTVCGFTLEMHHPAAMTAAHRGIATMLRLIGVAVSGYRGNIGLFRLPWPPISTMSSSASQLSFFSNAGQHDMLSYVYSLPSAGHGILSVLVEVVEWRLTADAAGQGEGKMSGCLVTTTTTTSTDINKTNISKRKKNADSDGEALATESVLCLRRGIYLGKMQFWTNTDTKKPHVGKNHKYAFIHAASAGDVH